MLKIVSLVTLIAGLVWTWTLFNSTSKMNTQTHAEIQSKLALLIEDTIKNKKPQSSDFQINQLYTSAINENLVSAHFSYQFKDILKNSSAADNYSTESVEQSVTGYALLAKIPSENSDLQKWVIQSIKTSQETVNFSEGLAITAGSENK